MSFTPETSVLLLIDLQEKLMPAIHEGEAVIDAALRLAKVAKMLDIPVLATEQSPDGIGPNVASVKAVAETTLVKQHFDATREDAWTSFIPEGRTDIVVAGCETHVCVLQTLMGMRRLNIPVRLVTDAVGSRTNLNRDAAIHRAEKHGAELVTTEMVFFEWMETADHPRFRDMLKLIR